MREHGSQGVATNQMEGEKKYTCRPMEEREVTEPGMICLYESDLHRKEVTAFSFHISLYSACPDICRRDL